MFIFEVLGDPKPQEQMETACNCRAGQKCKKWLYNPSKKAKEQIQWQIKSLAPAEPLKGPVELSIWFFLAVPKSTPSKTRLAMINRVILPCITPDEDNLSYLVTNALKEIVYEDDKQVCAKHVYKYYGPEPKTIIKVKPILEVTAVGLHEVDL